MSRIPEPVGGEFPRRDEKTRSRRADALKVIAVVVVSVSAMAMLVGLYVWCFWDEYVPSTDDVLDRDNWEHIFFVEATNIQGVYGTRDVSSTVYSYETASLSSEEFWSQVEQNLMSEGWTRRSSPDSILRRYVLVYKEDGSCRFVFEARIGLNPTTRRVAVGYVLNSCYPDPDPVAVRDLVADFADERVWPKLREIISDE